MGSGKSLLTCDTYHECERQIGWWTEYTGTALACSASRARKSLIRILTLQGVRKVLAFCDLALLFDKRLTLLRVLLVVKVKVPVCTLGFSYTVSLERHLRGNWKLSMPRRCSTSEDQFYFALYNCTLLLFNLILLCKILPSSDHHFFKILSLTDLAVDL